MVYLPKINKHVYLKFWGTRGSITVSGGEFQRSGGNTPCLEIVHDGQSIIIDAGTGIRPLGHQLLKEKKQHVHLLFGHTHWDHISGFPFFTPAYESEFKIDIYGAKGFGKGLKHLLGSILERAYFPVKLEEMEAQMHFHTLKTHEPLEIAGIRIEMAYAIHPGTTLCFKLKLPGMTIGYASDNEFLLGYHGHPNDVDIHDPIFAPNIPLIMFFKGCDILIHEAQYTPAQYRKKVGWGHSSLANVAVLLRETKIKRWIITHHDPDDTDELLQNKLLLAKQILSDCNVDCQVELAYDGYTLFG